MALAAHLAGRAINRTRTTACHAVPYPITMRFGIPHGHAVALTLPEMLVFNAGVTDDDVLDPQGKDAARERIELILGVLGVASPEDGRHRLLELMRAISLETSLAELGIIDHSRILDEGFDPNRVGNNPRRLTREALASMLTAKQ